MIATGPARHRTLRFDTAPASIPRARRALDQTFDEWGLPSGSDVGEDARLIVSELAANCVRHAGESSPTFTVTAVLGDGHLALGVHDAHPERPAVTRARSGLGVVRDIVAECDGITDVQETADGGKTVWVVLPLPPPPCRVSPAAARTSRCAPCPRHGPCSR